MKKLLWLMAALAVFVTVFAFAGNRRAPALETGVIARTEIDVSTFCPFPRTARRLRTKGPLRVVAIGSSSTEGAGASSSAKTYPAQLNAYLTAALPGMEIQVHNRGKSGEIAAQTLTRFAKDVLALDVDLVIWQVGTNDALRNLPFPEFERVIEYGVAQLRERQVDVALLDLQYLGEGYEQMERYQRGIEAVAERLRVARIPRWHLMKDSVTKGQHTLGDLVTKDGLHTTDLTYQITAAYTSQVIVRSCAPTEPQSPP